MQDKYTEPHWDSAALTIIDMQNGFVSPKIEKEGTKAFQIINKIQTLLETFRLKRKPIVHVIRSYLPNGSDADIYRKGIVERGEFILSPESEQAKIVEMLTPPNSPELDFDILQDGQFQGLGPNEWVMYKPRLGAFYNTPFEGWLRSRNVDTLIFAGTFFPNCVRTSITEANERDFRCVAARDAIFGIYEKGEKELAAIGVTVLNADEIADLV
jgi:nicotinamidase-related amidase